MRTPLELSLAAVVTIAAAGIEAAVYIPLREIWSGALLAAVWLWAHHRGWLQWIQQADDITWRDLLPKRVRPTKRNIPAPAAAIHRVATAAT